MNDADFAKLKPGRILMAGVWDMSGRGWKERPVVILNNPAKNDDFEEFDVACGSSKPPDSCNEPFAISVLGQRPHGHPRTGLMVETWFYAGWIETVKVGEVVRLLKRVPDYDFLRLRELIELYKNA